MRSDAFFGVRDSCDTAAHFLPQVVSLAALLTGLVQGLVSQLAGLVLPNIFPLVVKRLYAWLGKTWTVSMSGNNVKWQ